MLLNVFLACFKVFFNFECQLLNICRSVERLMDFPKVKQLKHDETCSFCDIMIFFNCLFFVSVTSS